MATCSIRVCDMLVSSVCVNDVCVCECLCECERCLYLWKLFSSVCVCKLVCAGLCSLPFCNSSLSTNIAGHLLQALSRSRSRSRTTYFSNISLLAFRAVTCQNESQTMQHKPYETTETIWKQGWCFTTQTTCTHRWYLKTPITWANDSIRECECKKEENQTPSEDWHTCMSARNHVLKGSETTCSGGQRPRAHETLSGATHTHTHMYMYMYIDILNHACKQ